MQADTNLQNTEIQSYEIAGCPNDEAFENILAGQLIAETEDYLLEWNSNKHICQVTFRENELVRLFEQTARLRLQSSRLKILNDKFSMYRFAYAASDSLQIDKVLESVSKLQFEDAIVEVSAFNSLIIKLKFANDILLLINIPKENLIEDNPTAVFSLLENRKTIVDNYNSVENIVIGMEAFLDQ